MKRRSNGPNPTQKKEMGERTSPIRATGLLLRQTPHRPAMPPPSPSLIVNGEYNRPTESAAGFGFRPGRSVSSSHFPPSLRLESALGSDKRRERAVTQSAASATRIHSFRGDSNRFRTKTEEPPRNQTFSICHFALGTPSRPIFSACIADFLCDRGPVQATP